MTQVASAERQQPLLVVGHGLRSAPALQVVEAALGSVRLVWLIDESVPENASALRLLRRVGTVVNTGGLTTRSGRGLGGSVLAERGRDLPRRGHRPAFPDRRRARARLSLAGGRAQRLWTSSSSARRCGTAAVPTPGFWEVPADRDRSAVEALAAMRGVPGGAQAAERAAVASTRCPWPTPTISCADVASLPTEQAERRDVPRAVPAEPSAGPATGSPDYVSVESLVAHGRISHFAVTGRFPLAEPFRETGFFIPADVSPAQLDDGARGGHGGACAPSASERATSTPRSS